jgi:cytochrome c biogenesis protein CcmG, thiol:disulfide interchange protein DsbE
MKDPELVKIDVERRFSPQKIFSFGLLFAFLALLGWGLMRVQAGPRDQGAAPDFTMETFEGEVYTLSELQGNVVVINFWASWCPPCREEAAYLEATWRAYQDEDVIFLGVDYVDTEEEALAYIQEFEITYPNGADLGTRISQAYRIQGVPETFFVDRDGNLQGVKIGPLYPPELEARIDELLAKPTSENPGS